MKLRGVYDRQGSRYVKWWIETLDGMKLIGGLSFNMPKAKQAVRRNLQRAQAHFEKRMFEYVLQLPDLEEEVQNA